MGVIKEGAWLDGSDLSIAQAELMLRILADAGRRRVRCVVCRSNQPKREAWATYAMELESKVTHQNSGDIVYRACPSCEPALDKFLFVLQVKH